MITNQLYIAIVIVSIVKSSNGGCSTAYGAPKPCNFLPAPPGHAPDCAKHGSTFCEYPEDYPMERNSSGF